MESNRYTARTAELVVQELGDELLIYDQRTDIAHSLTATAALVWRTCEGGASHDDLLRSVAGIDGDAEALVLGAVDALDEKGLLTSRATDASGISRRQAVRRMAGVGLAAVAAPFVVSAAVPTAQAAGSPVSCRKVNESCTGGVSNASNNCCTGVLTCVTARCCYPSGTKPGTLNCTTGANGNSGQCCSGACATSGNPNFCA